MYGTLFTSPKQGGILQSSGFLDLKSLMSLSRTAKAHALDELSLILLIENELTRHHQVSTTEEAIDLWKKVYRNSILKNHWLLDHRTPLEYSMLPASDILSEAVCYEVMLAKMMRTIPESRRLKVVTSQNQYARTVLHSAACSGNHDSIRVVLSLLPESQRFMAVNQQCLDRRTVLQYAARSGNLESIKTLIAFYPESEHLRIVRMQDMDGYTMMHRAVLSGKIEAVTFILGLLPSESHRLQVLEMQEENGKTVLHCAIVSGNTVEMVRYILTLYPESKRLQAVSVKDRDERTAIHLAAHLGKFDSIKAVLELLPESQRLLAVAIQGPDRSGRTVKHLAQYIGSNEGGTNNKRSHSDTQHGDVDIEQQEAKRQRSEVD